MWVLIVVLLTPQPERNMTSIVETFSTRENCEFASGMIVEPFNETVPNGTTMSVCVPQ